MNRNKKILNVTMAAGMAAVLGTTPVLLQHRKQTMEYPRKKPYM